MNLEINNKKKTINLTNIVEQLNSVTKTLQEGGATIITPSENNSDTENKIKLINDEIKVLKDTMASLSTVTPSTPTTSTEVTHIQNDVNNMKSEVQQLSTDLENLKSETDPTIFKAMFEENKTNIAQLNNKLISLSTKVDGMGTTSTTSADLSNYYSKVETDARINQNVISTLGNKMEEIISSTRDELGTGNKIFSDSPLEIIIAGNDENVKLTEWDYTEFIKSDEYTGLKFYFAIYPTIIPKSEYWVDAEKHKVFEMTVFKNSDTCDTLLFFEGIVGSDMEEIWEIKTIINDLEHKIYFYVKSRHNNNSLKLYCKQILKF